MFTAFMKDRDYNWHYVPEYVRDFIDTYGITAIKQTGPLIQCKFMDRQINLERKLPDVAEGWVTDSPVFLSWMYAVRYSNIRNIGGVDIEAYIALKDCYKGFLRSLAEYDYFIHVKREKKYMKDGTRTQSEEEAREIDTFILSILQWHNVKIIKVEGSTEERCQTLFNLIQKDLTKNES